MEVQLWLLNHQTWSMMVVWSTRYGIRIPLLTLPTLPSVDDGPDAQTANDVQLHPIPTLTCLKSHLIRKFMSLKLLNRCRCEKLFHQVNMKLRLRFQIFFVSRHLLIKKLMFNSWQWKWGSDASNSNFDSCLPKISSHQKTVWFMSMFWDWNC